MSRIGKKPITIPKGVTIAIREGELEVKGPRVSEDADSRRNYF